MDKKLKEAMNSLHEWEKQNGISLFTDDGLNKFAEQWTKYQKDNVVIDKVMEQVRSQIQPLVEQNKQFEEKIDRLIAEKGVSNLINEQDQRIPKQEPVKEKKTEDVMEKTVLEQKVDIDDKDVTDTTLEKIEVSKAEWSLEKVSEFEKKLKYKDSIIQVISDENENRVARIDNGTFEPISNEAQIEDMKSKVEKDYMEKTA